jgi:hypothetical protein
LGAPFFDIPPDPATPGILEHAADGIIFVVCRVVLRPGRPVEVHLQGIASDRKTAVAMCRDETYFIGPIPINVSLPEDRVEWPAIEYPLRKK